MCWQISQQLPPDYKIGSTIVVIEELTVHFHLNVTARGAPYSPVDASYSCRCFLSRVDRLAAVGDVAGVKRACNPSGSVLAGGFKGCSYRAGACCGMCLVELCCVPSGPMLAGRIGDGWFISPSLANGAGACCGT